MMERGSILWLVLLGVSITSAPSTAEITITPVNVQIPEFAGEDFSFDFAISDPLISDHFGSSALAFQTNITYTGPGTLTFDEISSEAVADDPDYWIYGNSSGAIAWEESGSYVFQDYPDNLLPEDLLVDDIMVRYSFIWDGKPGDYTFSLNLELDEDYSYVMGQYFGLHTIAFDSGVYPGDASSFTVTMPIPEPATLLLLGLGGLILRKRRR